MVSDQGTNGCSGDVDDRQVIVRRRPASSYATEPLGYVDSLDGLRGYSMAVVMFYHARFTFFPGGFLAVSLFFTLSGFLITSLLIREWASDRAIDMRAFWSRRFRRLIPAAWLTLTAILALGAFNVWDGDQLKALRGDIPFSLLQVVNWHYVLEDRTYGGSFVAPSPVEHYWSLAVEEQFYLLLPLVVLAVLTIGRRKSLQTNLKRLAFVFTSLIIGGAVLNGLLARSSIDRAYFGTDTRMPEMVAGALLACAMARRLRFPDGMAKRILRAVGVAGLLGIIALYLLGSLRAQWMYPWGLLATSVTTCAVIAGSLQGGIAARFLAFKPAAMLGRMSYGTYLIHWPVFLILTPARIGLAPVPLFAVRAIVSISLSTLMYYFVEEPVRRRRALKEWRFATALAVILPVLLLSTFVVTHNAEGSSIIQRDPTGSAVTSVPATRTEHVLIIGDQGASVLARSVSSKATVDGKSVRMEVSASAVDDCGLVNGGWVLVAPGTVERDVARCADAVPTWAAAISEQRPDLVLVIPSERDAAIRRPDSRSDWAVPVPTNGTDFRALEIGTTLDTLAEAADSVKAELVVTSAPTVLRDAPSPPPERTPESGAQAEEFAAVEEAIMKESAPDPASFPDDEARLAELSRTAQYVAKMRGLEFVDLSSDLTEKTGKSVPLDATAESTALPKSVAASLTKRLAELSLNRVVSKAVPAPAPESLRDVQIPEAPPVTPRLKVAPGERTTLLVVGDSLAYGLGFGLVDWATDKDVDVTVAAQFGCPIARGGRYRIQRDSQVFEPGCDWGPTFPELIQTHRPEVVMLSSSVWQVVDRQLPGDTQYRHLGDKLMDRYVLSEFLTAVDALASGGATVALFTSPYIESGREKGYTGLPESDPKRMDQLNDIIREVAKLRPTVTRIIDLAAWLGGQDGRDMDPTRRPDGIHFTDAESRSIADWTGPQLDAIARGQ
ncbi:MAG: acyltransferase [Microthrixaceae bacterium]|nr:acyltransferase [Microthrixaceae bacterium]